MAEAPGGEGSGKGKGKGKRPYSDDQYNQEPPSPVLNQQSTQQLYHQYPSFQSPPPPPQAPSQHSRSSTLQSPLQSPLPLPFPSSSSLPNLPALAPKPAPAPVPERAQTYPNQLPTVRSASPTRTSTTRLPTPASPTPLPPRLVPPQPTRSKTAPSVPTDVYAQHTHQYYEPFRDDQAIEAAISEQQKQQVSTSVASASSSSTQPTSSHVYTPVSVSAASTSSYVPAATEVEGLAPNSPAYARHVANNDPEREAMLSGDHITSEQFSAGLSVDSDADSAMGDVTGQ
ncbi:hypothetical protein B0T20DRAFT_116979 [Sordaria brevicollis]|uniref:Uncharacterized protein n=1 Tax=Sordaria brevicollis TaxID=83679 RepID=A0AAE0PKA3_SORBR|nr:hypothetical protein B0T20DRAFT_116979 [Sordaria brevicollis]